MNYWKKMIDNIYFWQGFAAGTIVTLYFMFLMSLRG